MSKKERDQLAHYAEGVGNQPPARDVLVLADTKLKHKKRVDHVSVPLTFCELQSRLEAVAVETTPEVDETTPVVITGKVNGKHVGAHVRAVAYDYDPEGNPVIYIELAE